MISTPPSSEDEGRRLIIVGSSARAAAFSALRAGFAPACVDQFADADLQAAARCRKAQRFADVAEGLGEFGASPVLYTGGLENHPELLEKLASERSLLGNPAGVIRQVRDPFALAEALKQGRMPHLELRCGDDPPPRDGTWLLKPIRSAGGRGIVRWTEEAGNSPTLRGPHYFQRVAQGTACSGVFVAREGAGDVQFVGLTEQLVGEQELGAPPFAWCGNIGPIALPVRAEHAVRRMANYFKWKFQLRGLFGIDFIADGEQVWLTEVNPRYTGSVELLEFATGQNLVASHAACFGVEAPAPAMWTPLPDMWLAKGVVYAPREMEIERTPRFTAEGYREWPVMADIPAAGTTIAAGEPVCMVYARAGSVGDCREALFAAAREVLRGHAAEK